VLFVARIAEPESGGDKIWATLEESISKLAEIGITPLYISRRSEYSDTSLIVRARTDDDLRDTLLGIFKGAVSQNSILIFPLIRMRLFDVPENIGKEAIRFLLTIKVRASDANRVYESLSLLRPSSDITFTYLAFTSDHPCDTLNLSAFAKSSEHVLRFIQQELRAIPGILASNFTSISKSKRLLSYSDMIAVLNTELGMMSIQKPILDLSDLLQ